MMLEAGIVKRITKSIEQTASAATEATALPAAPEKWPTPLPSRTAWTARTAKATEATESTGAAEATTSKTATSELLRTLPTASREIILIFPDHRSRGCHLKNNPGQTGAYQRVAVGQSLGTAEMIGIEGCWLRGLVMPHRCNRPAGHIALMRITTGRQQRWHDFIDG